MLALIRNHPRVSLVLTVLGLFVLLKLVG